MINTFVQFSFVVVFIFIESDFILVVLRQIDIDCQFLEAENIMDYSLLIGVHICNYSNNGEMNLSPSGNNSANFSTSRLQLLHLFSASEYTFCATWSHYS